MLPVNQVILCQQKKARDSSCHAKKKDDNLVQVLFIKPELLTYRLLLPSPTRTKVVQGQIATFVEVMIFYLYGFVSNKPADNRGYLCNLHHNEW